MTIETRPAVAPVTQPKTTADVLRHAALIIEERGWNQGGWEEDGRVCALGALNVASSGRHWDASNALDPAIALIRFLGGAVIDFNDTPGRTAAEVVAALRAAADEADR